MPKTTTVKDPYIIRLRGKNRHCRGMTVDVRHGKPTHFALGRAPKMTFWVGNARLPDPTKPERFEHIATDHIPGTDCFLEREPALSALELDRIATSTFQMMTRKLS